MGDPYKKARPFSVVGNGSVPSGLETQRMEGMAFWSYQQKIDELKQLLACTAFELEAAKEEKKRGEETEKQLVFLLKEISRERDELREQLHKLINKLCQTDPCNLVPNLHPESPAVRISRGNSTSTESDSFSEAYNGHHSSYGSPADSFFDAASLPEMGIPHQPIPQEFRASATIGMTQMDPASALIDQLAMKKKLPERGKFLEAVTGAGPLLKNLLVAGPLPQWRNPPPLQPFQVPPVSITCRTPALQKSNAVSNVPHPDILNNAAARCNAATLNLGRTVFSCQKKRPMLISGLGEDLVHGLDPVPVLKHQKLL